MLSNLSSLIFGAATNASSNSGAQTENDKPVNSVLKEIEEGEWTVVEEYDSDDSEAAHNFERLIDDTFAHVISSLPDSPVKDYQIVNHGPGNEFDLNLENFYRDEDSDDEIYAVVEPFRSDTAILKYRNGQKAARRNCVQEVSSSGQSRKSKVVSRREAEKMVEFKAPVSKKEAPKSIKRDLVTEYLQGRANETPEIYFTEDGHAYFITAKGGRVFIKSDKPKEVTSRSNKKAVGTATFASNKETVEKERRSKLLQKLRKQRKFRNAEVQEELDAAVVGREVTEYQNRDGKKWHVRIKNTQKAKGGCEPFSKNQIQRSNRVQRELSSRKKRQRRSDQTKNHSGANNNRNNCY